MEACTSLVSAEIKKNYEYMLSLQSAQFLRRAMSWMHKKWPLVDEATKEEIRSDLREKFDTYELQSLQYELETTFIDEHHRFHSIFGSREMAGLWRGFLEIISYQAPPDTKSINSHLPVV